LNVFKRWGKGIADKWLELLQKTAPWLLRLAGREATHHDGHIDWWTYEHNQRVIADNANMKGEMVRGALRRGVAGWTAALRALRTQAARGLQRQQRRG
jgi:hypothetical protein